MQIFVFVMSLIGLAEVVSNGFHLSRKSIQAIGESAKRQHQELSLSLPPVHFFVKAILMLAFGVLFVGSGLYSLFDPKGARFFWMISVVLFGAYGLVQAIVYRTEIKVWPAMVVYNLPLILAAWVF